jgi:hypothetical protein
VMPASDGAEPPNFWSLYRWHIQDPIHFEKDLRVTIQALGWGSDGKYKKTADDIASVAYWYQAEPHAPFPKLPPAAERLRDAVRPPMRILGAQECESLKITDCAPEVAAEAQDVSGIGTGWSNGAQLFVRARKVGDFVEIAIPATGTEARKVALYATRATDYGILRFTVNGKAAGKDFDGYAEKPTPTGPIDLGVHTPKADAPANGKFILRAEVVGTNPASTGNKYYFGLDAVLLEKP